MNNVANIRETFISYFESNGHEVVSSSNLVPQNDPTLMFVNSGMVQFKNVFTGQEIRSNKTAVTSQKCVRAGGKHNDLENVGHTARHHTFFEMLGNFSFGDYFKDVAIEHAWKLLTQEYCLTPEKLLVTVFHEDLEARNLWKKISGLNDDRIISIKTSDNFWSMGEVGPCGPCSEIFYDHGESIKGGPPGSKDEDGDRFIEIWNLVFMQYEQLNIQDRISLPKQCIDTGMGLERLATVLQGKHDNYEIDLFQSIINNSANLCGNDPNGLHKTSHRVISDHLRSASFLIADGVLPSNEGRGYVLRRIMRRGMRHAHIMGCLDPLLCKLVPTLVSQMGEAFPELIEAEKLIFETLKLEEIKFKETLERGLKILDDEVAKISSENKLDGKIAFKLYDTYGFPLDLTADILKNKNITIDIDGFKKSMKKQKITARLAWKGSGDTATQKIWLDLSKSFKPSKFLGYDILTLDGLTEIIVFQEKLIENITKNQEVEVVFNQTPFYALSGGQEGDKGYIENDNFKAKVIDCWKTSLGIFVHKIKVIEGNLKLNDPVTLKVDVNNRNNTASNHSATHLLHQVLRDVLGEHVSQKGSLVSSSRLRFDFNHSKTIDKEELFLIEKKINQKIIQNSEVRTRNLTLNNAKKEGALALFGEKYGSEVRVVSMGESTIQSSRSFWSVELCGGTHVSRTGNIGIFKILNESAVSSGIRRIEAITGISVLKWFNEQNEILKEISRELKVQPNLFLEKFQSLSQDKRNLEKELKIIKLKVSNEVEDNNIKQIDDIQFLGKKVNVNSPKELKGLADNYLKIIESGVVALYSIDNSKVSLVVAVTKDLSKVLSAVDLVKVGSLVIGGNGGGGRPTMAQSGGTKPLSIDKSLVTMEQYIKVSKKI